MFTKLIDASLQFRKLVLAMAIALVLFGIHAWMTLPIDAFPDISPTQVKIILKNSLEKTLKTSMMYILNMTHLNILM